MFEDDGEFDTLAGFLISRFGYIPQPGETYDFNDYQFIVEEADERRIISTFASPVEVERAEGETGENLPST